MAVDLSGQIAAIQAAIGAGVTSVSYEGKSTTFRSFDEMTKTVAYLQRAQARANGQPVAAVGLANFDRGYRRRGRWGGGPWGR